MSDHNRRYKKIVRVDDATDAKIRAYATEHSISASEACIALVGRADPAPAVQNLLAPAALSPALPDDLTEAIARQAAAKGTTPDEQLVAAVRMGVKRIDALDKFAASKK